jgi:hypothetical protein
MVPKPPESEELSERLNSIGVLLNRWECIGKWFAFSVIKSGEQWALLAIHT